MDGTTIKKIVSTNWTFYSKKEKRETMLGVIELGCAFGKSLGVTLTIIKIRCIKFSRVKYFIICNA